MPRPSPDGPREDADPVPAPRGGGSAGGPPPSPGAVDRANAYLLRLRGWRSRPDRGRLITGDLDAMAREAEKTHARLGSVIEGWLSVVPEPMRSESRIVALRNGVLTVEVASASARYHLDRQLRGALLQKLRAAIRAPLQRVRLQVAAPPRSAGKRSSSRPT